MMILTELFNEALYSDIVEVARTVIGAITQRRDQFVVVKQRTSAALVGIANQRVELLLIEFDLLIKQEGVDVFGIAGVIDVLNKISVGFVLGQIIIELLSCEYQYAVAERGIGCDRVGCYCRQEAFIVRDKIDDLVARPALAQYGRYCV